MDSTPMVSALGWTLVHSLWQAALVATVLYVTLGFLRRVAPVYRHALCLLAAFVILAMSCWTFHMMITEAPQMTTRFVESTIDSHIVLGPSGEPGVGSASFFEKPRRLQHEFREFIGAHMDWIVLIWMAGVLILLARMAGGMTYTATLRRKGLISAPPIWQHKLNQLVNQAGLGIRVVLAESSRVSTPIVLGVFKPFILIPIGTFTRLPTDQVEAIILHELAHIARRDVLVNILQSLVEVVFFFNPAVRWVSDRIREERESCCDEAALISGAGAMDLARALVSLQELKMHPPKFAMSVLGKKNHLLGRIQRIFGHAALRPVPFPNALIVFSCLACFFASSLLSQDTQKKEQNQPNPAELLSSSQNSVELSRLIKEVFPSGKGSTSMNRESGPDWFRDLFGLISEINLTVEEGKIHTLHINGEPVPDDEIPEYYSELIGLLTKHKYMALSESRQRELVRAHFDDQQKIGNVTKKEQVEKTSELHGAEKELSDVISELEDIQNTLGHENVHLSAELSKLQATLDGWRLIREELVRDGILEKGESFKTQIERDRIIINDVELPESLFPKYNALLKEHVNAKFKEGTTIRFVDDDS